MGSGGEISCPICGGRVFRYCTKRSHGVDWHIERCRGCGYGFVSNRPDPQTLGRIYEEEGKQRSIGEVSLGSYAGRRDARSMARLMARLSSVRGDWLDIGSGDGAFSFYGAREGYRPILLDQDSRCGAAEELIAGSEFHLGGFEGYSPVGRPGAILMSQVLEHALDPVGWLRRAAELLHPEGVLGIALPNFGGIYRILGARDPHIIPPLHLNYFTPRAMRLALEQAGLRLVRYDTLSAIPTGHPDRRFSMRRRMVGHGWNSISWMLRPTPWGIYLRVFAKVRAGHGE